MLQVLCLWKYLNVSFSWVIANSYDGFMCCPGQLKISLSVSHEAWFGCGCSADRCTIKVKFLSTLVIACSSIEMRLSPLFRSVVCHFLHFDSVPASWSASSPGHFLPRCSTLVHIGRGFLGACRSIVLRLAISPTGIHKRSPHNAIYRGMTARCPYIHEHISTLQI